MVYRSGTCTVGKRTSEIFVARRSDITPMVAIRIAVVDMTVKW
jgi:hypothetical protein